MERVEHLLTAKYEREEEAGAIAFKPKQSGRWASIMSLVQPLFQGFGATALYKEAKNTQFVQLSQFEGFTDAILVALSEYLDAKVEAIKENLKAILGEFTKASSKWLQWKPKKDGDFNIWTPVVDVDGFVNAALVRDLSTAA